MRELSNCSRNICTCTSKIGMWLMCWSCRKTWWGSSQSWRRPLIRRRSSSLWLSMHRDSRSTLSPLILVLVLRTGHLSLGHHIRHHCGMSVISHTSIMPYLLINLALNFESTTRTTTSAHYMIHVHHENLQESHHS